MNYKKHSSSIPFISSLRAEDTKKNYGGCLKNLQLPVNSHLSEMDQILKESPNPGEEKKPVVN